MCVSHGVDVPTDGETSGARHVKIPPSLQTWCWGNNCGAPGIFAIQNISFQNLSSMGSNH